MPEDVELRVQDVDDAWMLAEVTDPSAGQFMLVGHDDAVTDATWCMRMVATWNPLDGGEPITKTIVLPMQAALALCDLVHELADEIGFSAS